MAFARINAGVVIDMHVLAEAETPNGATFLADLWGGSAEDYIEVTDVYPGVAWTWDGNTFIAPPEPGPDPVAPPEQPV